MSPGSRSLSVLPRQPQGPCLTASQLCIPSPRCSHAPLSQTQPQTAAQLAGRPVGQQACQSHWEGGHRGDTSGKQSQLPEPKHTLGRGLRKQVCVCVGGYLTPFLPARPQEVPHELISAIPLPPARCPHSLTVPADSLGWTRRILPCSPGNKFTHSLMFMETKHKSGPQGARVWKFFLLSDLASTLPGSQLSMCYGSC